MSLEDIRISKSIDYIKDRDIFVSRLKNEARSGLSDSFMQFLISYYNYTEKYIGELELENIRLYLNQTKINKQNNSNAIAALELGNILLSETIKGIKKL